MPTDDPFAHAPRPRSSETVRAARDVGTHGGSQPQPPCLARPHPDATTKPGGLERAGHGDRLARSRGIWCWWPPRESNPRQSRSSACIWLRSVGVQGRRPWPPGAMIRVLRAGGVSRRGHALVAAVLACRCWAVLYGGGGVDLDSVISVDASLPSQSAYIASVREQHPRAYEQWTAEEDARLVGEYRSGRSSEDVARDLGRQPSAVESRLMKVAPELVRGRWAR